MGQDCSEVPKQGRSPPILGVSGHTPLVSPSAVAWQGQEPLLS